MNASCKGCTLTATTGPKVLVDGGRTSVVVGCNAQARGTSCDMEYFLLMLAFGIIVALIANSKGRNPIGWFIYGALLFLIAIVHVLVIPRSTKAEAARARASGRVPCPHCAEMVLPAAKVCPHCRRDVDTQEPTVAGDASCPHCGATFRPPEKACPKCSGNVVGVV